MGDGGGSSAINALQIIAIQVVSLQEAIHTGKGGATNKITNLHSIAVEVAATRGTILCHGRIINPLGQHRPTPGISVSTTIGWDLVLVNQAHPRCIVVGDLIHHKAAGKQPFIRGRR